MYEVVNAYLQNPQWTVGYLAGQLVPGRIRYRRAAAVSLISARLLHSGKWPASVPVPWIIS